MNSAVDTSAPPAPAARRRAVPGWRGIRLVGRRILWAVPVLWGVTFLTFGVLNLLPGDAAEAMLGSHATQRQVDALAAKLHLDDPFFVRYGHWLGGVLHGDLGSSLTNGQSVTTVLAQRLPVSLELVAFAFVISLGLAVPVALLAVRKPGGIADRLSLVIGTIGLSVAPFVLALVLILVFAVQLGWLPAIGFSPVGSGLGRNLKSLILPAASMGFPLFGAYCRLFRADLLEQLTGEDYVLTARAKGASPWRLLVRHVLRNSVFGLMTLVGLNLGSLIGATVIIEQIFALPGIGQALLQAINDRDVPVVEGIVLVFAVLVVLANLLIDLLYDALDPRIRYGTAHR
jgi:peptide/nickel transport system permease protein